MSFYTPPRRMRRLMNIADLKILTTLDYWAHHKIQIVRMRRRDKIDIRILGTRDATRNIKNAYTLKHNIIASAISGVTMHCGIIHLHASVELPLDIHAYATIHSDFAGLSLYLLAAISNHLMLKSRTAIRLGRIQVPPRKLSSSTLLCLD